MTICPVCRKPQPNPRRTMHKSCAEAKWRLDDAERHRARNILRRKSCDDLSPAEIEAIITASLQMLTYQRRTGRSA